MILSESALLVLEPQDAVATAEQYGTLLFWSELRRLRRVRRKLVRCEEVLLEWLRDDDQVYLEIIMPRIDCGGTVQDGRGRPVCQEVA